MEIQQYIRILIKRWWLILLLTVVGTGSAIFYVWQEPPIYRSTVTLLLSPALRQDSILPTTLSDRTGELAQTFSRYLKTRTFADLVIEREGLSISSGELVRSISTNIIEGTPFFEITATSQDPARAQFLATAIANNFISANLAQQQEQLTARRTAGDVDNQQALLREKLERERQYYEGQVSDLRLQIDQINQQPPSASRDELIGSIQEQLSEYETRLLQIMSDQIALQPRLDNAQIDTVTVLEPAPLPQRPISTGKIQNILFAFMASLVLGFTISVGLEYLDYTVKGPEELEMLVGEPTLGVLNNLTKGDADALVTLSQPRAPTSEAFRALRTNILFSQAGKELRSLVVTSAGPGEGKTTVAANLAVVMADAGRRVLLVDADMRRPTVHRRFGVNNGLGLSNLIIAEDPTDPDVLYQHIQPGPVQSLNLLPSGPIPLNPAALLSSERAREIFDLLEQAFDVVIYDTPPALTVTDAVILASRTDATLQVVHAGKTRREVVVKTRSTLQRVGANLLSPVLNRVRAADAGYYQYYAYGTYYQDDPGGKKPSRTKVWDGRANGNGHANGSGAGVREERIDLDRPGT